MKNLFIILFIISLIGCKLNQEHELPQGILSKEKMTTLLIDVHLTEATIDLCQSKNINITSFAQQQYKLLFKKHNITQKQFEENIKFYADHIELIDETYTAAIETLNKKQSEPIK